MLSLSTLTLFLSWRCSILCSHCGFSCGPRRRGRMPLETALELIDHAVEMEPSLRMVAYSGGEPFLFYEDVLTCMRRAAERELSGGLVSNCSWAGSDAVVRKRMSVLKGLGLEEFIVSLDDFHLAHVPLDNIRRVVLAALERGIRVGVNVLMTRSSRIRREDVPELLGLPQEGVPPELMWVQESSPLLFGRARNNFAREELCTHPEEVFRGLPCHFVTRNLVVSPDMQVYACCGFGGSTDHGPAALTSLGDLGEDSLDALFRKAQGNLALNIMAEFGPHKLLELARETGDTVQTPESYVSPCDICGEISTNDRLRQSVSKALRGLVAG